MIKKNKKFNNTKKLSYKKNKKNTNKKNKTLKKKNYKLRGGNICKLLLNSNSLGSSPKSSLGSSIGSSIGSSLNKPMTIKYSNKYVEPNPLFYTAITNVGNTCYINATLQLLWSIPEIRKDIINLHQANLYTQYATYDYRSQIIIILAAMFNTFYSKSSEDNIFYGKNNTNNIIQQLEMLNLTSIENNNYIENTTQQDAQEYLSKLLVFLCNSENPTQNNCSFIDLQKHLDIRVTVETKCNFPGNIPRQQRDPYLDWSIPLNISKDINIDIDIKTLLAIELTTDNDSLTDCLPNNTTSENLSTKYVGPGTISTTYKPKNNLLIQLLRFTHDPNFIIRAGNKISTNITPNNIINLDNKQFKLQGCIIHLGGTNGGHYVYLVFDKDGNPSKLIDDKQIISKDTQYNEHLANGYIYYYRKQ